ncbi:MAG TPA: hypothetical protein VKR58_06945, partial [Aquella sp.]|nr:hypothetical protein [Aquella sp.]
MTDNLVISEVTNALDAPLKESSSIKATNDIEAIQVWLTEFQNSPNTFTSYRQAAERFLMWCMQNKTSLASL